ncbi:MAG: hypothetical protein IT562_09575 [Alphaproteobacteria bacterium]|nr:hypothetical protein [Alphaproteobacteria bacterium]
MFLIGAAILALAASALAADPRLLLSYEALPSAQIDLPRAKTAAYEKKLPLARIVAGKLVPDIVAAVGLDPAKARTRVEPGGYALETNPSLQTQIALTPADGERLAAALGYVLRQEGVLLSDLHAADGNSYQVTIQFPRGKLTPALADEFFRRAAAIDRGLGGGFAALGDAMIFLNLRGADGKPYSGLADGPFRDRLGATSHLFPGSAVARSGKASARLVENDWKAAPNGEDYARIVDRAVAALDRLRARHTVMVRSQAKLQGWE